MAEKKTLTLPGGVRLILRGVGLVRVRDSYPQYGLGLTWSGPGCIGSTYGEPGTNHFFEVALYAGWHWEFRVSWKRVGPDETGNANDDV